MSRIEKYLNHMKHGGTDLILETAARDRRISDEEYDRLWTEVDVLVRQAKRRPKGISPIHKLRDREVARQELSQ